MDRLTENLRNSVVRNLLLEEGESPSFSTNNKPTNSASIGTAVGNTLSGGIAGMQGDTSPKSFASLLYDRRFAAILPFYLQLLQKEMGQ
jgi:hypothetical protein